MAVGLCKTNCGFKVYQWLVIEKPHSLPLLGCSQPLDSLPPAHAPSTLHHPALMGGLGSVVIYSAISLCDSTKSFCIYCFVITMGGVDRLK